MEPEIETKYLDPKLLKSEIIVKNFTWAQWDPLVQALYYIHLKPVSHALLEKKGNQSENFFNPTLSAYQFHDDLPTETVVSKTNFCKLILFYTLQNLIKNVCILVKHSIKFAKITTIFKRRSNL